MINKEFKDLKISPLGLGCMRFPVLDGDHGKIDYGAAEEIIACSMENGINYYDTAWGYHNGNSEIVSGKILSRYPRESYYLASKFPGYDRENLEKKEEIFERQLEKCGVDYFDFYLFHNVSERSAGDYLNPDYDLYGYLLQQKKNGRIRHLGFSTHGNCGTIRRFLEACGEGMEFCQIQLNYIDWTFQDGAEKLALLKEWNLPVWIMEPARGGQLAKLSEQHRARLNALRPGESDVSWAFRFLRSIPEVTVTLSGMSSCGQVEENVRTFSEEKLLSEEERETLFSIAGEMLEKKSVPCTACRYCTESCPQKLDIPKLLALYNEHTFTQSGIYAPIRDFLFPEGSDPRSCIGCRSCEKACPQQIKIADYMAELAKSVEV